MNAFQPSKPPLQPVPKPRRVPRRSPSKQNHPYRGATLEMTAKLVVNVVLSTAAIAALVRLLPFQLSRQAKLHEIQVEVKRTENRVNRLSSDFRRDFDPQQARTVMQQQSHRVAPDRRPVVWLNEDNP